LALGLEAGNDLLRAHPQLDDLDGHPPANRMLLLRQVHLAHTTLPEAVEDVVGTNMAGCNFGGWIT
jgi:hypothetical protein